MAIVRKWLCNLYKRKTRICTILAFPASLFLCIWFPPCLQEMCTYSSILVCMVFSRMPVFKCVHAINAALRAMNVVTTGMWVAVHLELPLELRCMVNGGSRDVAFSRLLSHVSSLWKCYGHAGVVKIFSKFKGNAVLWYSLKTRRPVMLVCMLHGRPYQCGCPSRLLVSSVTCEYHMLSPWLDILEASYIVHW